MDKYRKEVIQVSTWKNDIKVQYFYDKNICDMSTLTELKIKFIMFNHANDKNSVNYYFLKLTRLHEAS